jgi:TonB family protein
MKNIGSVFILALVSLSRLAAKDEKPAPASLVADGPAMVRTWGPPVYPADALKEKVSGRVTTRIIVDETGAIAAARVLKATDPRLGEAAVTAVKTWTFAPAIENEKPVAQCLDVPFNFDAQKGAKTWKPGLLPEEAWMPRPAPRTVAVPRNTPPGDYPAVLLERKLSGEAIFLCVVQPDGHAANVRIVAVTHSDFVLPALAALEKWEFTPAQQGDLSTASELRGTVSFDSVGTTRAEVLAANGIAAPDGSAPVNQPMPQVVSDPVWPYAFLTKGEGGSATVEFMVEATGRVTGVKVREATHPDFGQSVVAALEQCSFDPAMTEGKIVAVPLVQHVDFKPVSIDGDEPSKNPLVRLVRLERAGAIRGGGGLDEKLTPLYRVTPAYPAALRDVGKPSGQAVIEFVIDRDGRARMPRIVSASHPEFGWSAATSVSQWVFKAPLRAGKPTEVRVQIPINFTPPTL